MTKDNYLYLDTVHYLQYKMDTEGRADYYSGKLNNYYQQGYTCSKESHHRTDYSKCIEPPSQSDFLSLKVWSLRADYYIIIDRSGR